MDELLIDRWYVVAWLRTLYWWLQGCRLKSSDWQGGVTIGPLSRTLNHNCSSDWLTSRRCCFGQLRMVIHVCKVFVFCILLHKVNEPGEALVWIVAIRFPSASSRSFLQAGLSYQRARIVLGGMENSSGPSWECTGCTVMKCKDPSTKWRRWSWERRLKSSLEQCGASKSQSALKERTQG